MNIANRPPRGRAAFRSLRAQILALMVVCYLVPVIVLGQYMGTVFFTDLREKTESALTTGAEHAWALTVQNVERALTLARDATYDGELTNAWNSLASDAIGEAEYLRLCRSYIERKYSRDSLFSFAMFFPSVDPGMVVYNRSGYDAAARYQQSAHEQVIALGQTLDTRSLFVEIDGSMYLVRNLMNLRMERFGMLVLGVNREALYQPLSALAGQWDASIDVMLDRSGAVEVDWFGLAEGLSEDDGRGEIAYVRTSSGEDWELRLRVTVADSRVYGEIYAYRRLMRALLILLLPILLLIAWYVHRRITHPIKLLSDAAHRIEAGEFGVTVPMRGEDELGSLGRAFSNMSVRIKQLIDKTYKEEIALRDAQIQAMQSRINPHFINNALETINWQARMDGSEATGEMVEALSVLLNASMARSDRHIVPLREEIELADAYIYFITRHFGERLTIQKDISDQALDALVPILTIQPVLENAVEHGISPAGGGGIALTICRMASCLRIEIANSGRPASEADMARIAAAISGDSQGGAHLGLNNIAIRLRLIYGDRAVVTAFSDEAGRTVVRMEFPAGGAL